MSAIPKERYSMAQIMKYFPCTKSRIQAARKWQGTFGALNFRPQKHFTRCKLDLNAAKNFLEFLFSTNLLQDVAYGTSVLRYDNESAQTIPKTVLKGFLHSKQY